MLMLTPPPRVLFDDLRHYGLETIARQVVRGSAPDRIKEAVAQVSDGIARGKVNSPGGLLSTSYRWRGPRRGDNFEEHMTRLCKARAKSGTRCQAHAGPSGWCWAHDPALRRKRADARRKGGRARSTGDAGGGPEVFRPSKGTGRALSAPWRRPGSRTTRLGRTRALVSVYALALRAIESEISERLDVLEVRMLEVEHAKD